MVVLASAWPAAAVAGAHASNGHPQQPHTSNNSQRPQCPGQVLPNCGLTDGHHIYNTTTALDYTACCGICATDPQNCTAWVFVSDGAVWDKGPGQCKLRHSMASCRPELLNHVSGSLHQTNYTCDGSACVPDPGGKYSGSNCAGQCGRPPPPPTPVPPSPPKPPAAGRKPHILLLVVDDWGWSNVGYHRQNISAGGSDSSSSSVSPDDVVTPNFDALVRSGLELDRNYVHKFCSPTRSSIQSGRLPVHVNLVNADPQVSNPKDPISGWAGIPRNMTTIAQVRR